MKKKLLTIGATYLCSFIPGTAFGENVITRWNEQALNTAREQRLGAAPASRLYAMVNAAMYDAVNGINRARHISTRAQAIVSADNSPARANTAAAAAAAAHAVLSELYPDLSDDYDALLSNELSQFRAGRGSVNSGINWGEEVGYSVVDIRSDDGADAQETLPGGVAAGEYRADFTSAQYRNMTPFAIADKTPYISVGPPALTSPEYLAAHHEVRLLGDSSYPNTEYDEIFRFWAGSGGTARPPGEWIKIAMTVAEQEGTTDNIQASAHLFALLGLSLADATIATWESKFTYQFWRPATAINEASSDGNPDTVSDTSWVQRNGSIGSSPEHTSGQSAYAGAGSTVLADFYCNNNIEFTFEGDSAIAGSRTFSSFSDAAAEAGQARIYAGIHFQFSNQAGQEAGRGVAREVLSTALQTRSGKKYCPS